MLLSTLHHTSLSGPAGCLHVHLHAMPRPSKLSPCVFQVAVWVDGQVHEVSPLRTEAEAAVVCDAVTRKLSRGAVAGRCAGRLAAVHHALHAGLPVEGAQLRFQDGRRKLRASLVQE